MARITQKRHKQIKKRKGRKRIPKGYILRKGYTTKTGRRVPPTLIKDRGLRGKGPKILPKPRRGALRRYGYSTRASAEKRHKAMMSLARQYNRQGKNGFRSTILHLNLIANLSRRTNPRAYKVYRSDMKWLQRHKLRAKNIR
jgi:hypothetical protein